MARDSGPSILAYLHNARTYADRVAALRSLKNDIVGHVQKKEAWIAQGALEPVVALLQSSRAASKAVNGKPAQSMDPQALSDEEMVRLQALQVLSSFANGGTPFFPPISASGAIGAVLANISPNKNPPPVAITAVKTLINIIEACPDPSEESSLADELFQPRGIQSLVALCTRSSEWRLQTPQSPTVLVATLICRLCYEDKHAIALAESEIMDILAKELASFAVRDGYVMPGAHEVGLQDGRAKHIPGPASKNSDLSAILEALAAIVSDSKYRACRLIYSPALLAIFPWELVERCAMDTLLPGLPSQQARSHHSQASPFPALGSAASEGVPPFSPAPSDMFGHEQPSHDTTHDEDFTHEIRRSVGRLIRVGQGEAPEYQSPLTSWLIILVRANDDLERLMAANLLTTIFKSGFENRLRKEAILSFLVVPVLVQLLREADAISHAAVSSFLDHRTMIAWKTLETAPLILSRLITDSEVLQKAAHDAGAVKILSKLLKDAYEPVSNSAHIKMWSPNADTDMEVESSSPLCQLGPDSEAPVLSHRVRLRGSSLRAITALAAGKDEYRKGFVEQDIMPYIVQSLSTNPTKPTAPRDKGKGAEPDGPLVDVTTSGFGANPLPVVIAACHAIRTLSRSISILRTSLVDHNVAAPILRFLGHPDVDVQIAASAAICNLVTEVSPLREELGVRGVMKLLCEHAHSHTAALRLNALWALKHFVCSAAPRVKRQCLEELQSGWLVRLICDDIEEEALHKQKIEALRKQNIEAQAKAASGDDLDGDVEMDTPHLDGDNQPTWVLEAENMKAAFRDLDMNPQRRARHDDLAIQEQGLDFIRNLVLTSGGSPGPEPNESTEMIDHIFAEVGQDRFFDILSKKLQAKMLHGTPRRGGASGVFRRGSSSSTSGDSRILYPQSKIIQAVIYNLVHIAAGSPRHRQLIIAQTGLLKLLANHFGSKDKEVRSALCHLVSNLTWQEDEQDETACGLRAHELKKLGFMSRLEALERDDPELDVRERAKSALWQIKHVSSNR